jgi:hypothetical protein
MIFKIRKYLSKPLPFDFADFFIVLLVLSVALFIYFNNDSSVPLLPLEGFLVLPLAKLYRRVFLFIIFLVHFLRAIALNFGYASIKVASIAAIENIYNQSFFQFIYILIGISTLILSLFIYIWLDKKSLFTIKNSILIFFVILFSFTFYVLERNVFTAINFIGSEISYIKNLSIEDVSKNKFRELKNNNFRNSLRVVNGDDYYLFIVESLGIFKSKKANDYLLSIFQTRNIQNLEFSETTLTGAGTVGGEIRELCSKAIKHSLIKNDFFNSHECAPNFFKTYKYKSIVIHPGSKSIFNRPYVYKIMGFDYYFSAENLVKYKNCGGGWAGSPCDMDIISDLNELTKNITGPRFLYYLTINTHYPYKETRAIDGFVCGDYDIHDNLTCKHFVNLIGTLEAIQKFSLKSNGKFYIVGDHNPPMLGFSTKNDLVPAIQFTSAN